MTKIRGNAITIPGFTVGLQQDTAIAPLGSFVSASNLVPLMGSRMGIRGGSRVVNTLHDDAPPPTEQFGDTFVDEGDGTDLPDHTPSGSPEDFDWATGTYTTCNTYYVDTDVGYTNVALLYNSASWASRLAVNVASLAPDSADYTVRVHCVFPSTTNRDWTLGVSARGAANGSTCYRAYLNRVSAGTGEVGLLTVDATGATTASNTAVIVLNADTSYLLVLKCEGSTISVEVDNVEVLSRTDTTYSTAGKAGVWGRKSADGGTGNAWLEDFSVYTLGSGGGDGEVTHVPRIHPFSPVGMVAVTYSEGQEKHYATRLTTDGEFYTGDETTSRVDLTAAPSTSWDSAEPARPTAAELWEKLFLADGTEDYADRNTFLSLDGTGTVLEPHFAFDGGSAQALKPYCLEEFNNVLFLAGYGDETVGDRPEMVRHSFLGKSPDAADGFDSAAWIMIGAKGQRVTALCKGDTAMLVAKTNELYRISGYGRAYAGWQYEVEHIQQSLGLGCFGPYALCFAQGYWYGVGQNGPFRTDGVDVQPLRGPREHAWALVSSPEAFSGDYHPDRGLVLFSVRQATGLPEGLYLSNGEVTTPQDTYPNVLWAWDVNRDVWSSDLGFNVQFFHVRAIPTITTQSPQGTPTALAATDILTDGYTGNWTNGDATAETEFYERAGVSGSFSLAGTAGDGDTSLVRTGLNAHTKYYYYLQHLKGGIRSTPSSTIEVLTLIAPPVVNAFGGSLGDPPYPSYIEVTATEGGLDLTVEQSDDGISGWVTAFTVSSFPAGTTTYSVGSAPVIDENKYVRAYLSDSTWTPTDSDYSEVVQIPARS